MGTTWNPADKGASIFLANGNLNAGINVNSAVWNSVRATTSKSAGKFYYEIKVVTVDSVANARSFIGMADSNFVLSNFLGSTTNSGGYQDNTGWTVDGFTSHDASSHSFNTVNTILGIAVDLTGGNMWFAINNTYNQGNPANGTTPSVTFTGGSTLFPAVSLFGDAGPAVLEIIPSNFNFAPPSGFESWDAPNVFMLSPVFP